MIQLYSLVANIENAEIITLLTLIAVCIGLITNIWNLAGKTGRRFTTWEWIRIYFFGIIVFLCAITTFAKFVLPENADKMLEVLGLEQSFSLLTRSYQSLLLAIIKLCL